jgi:hypothetical protein
MLRQILTHDIPSINAMIADGKALRGPKVVALVPGLGKVEIHAVRANEGRLQVQLEPGGQWHTPQPRVCYKDEPDE